MRFFCEIACRGGSMFMDSAWRFRRSWQRVWMSRPAASLLDKRCDGGFYCRSGCDRVYSVSGIAVVWTHPAGWVYINKWYGSLRITGSGESRAEFGEWRAVNRRGLSFDRIGDISDVTHRVVHGEQRESRFAGYGRDEQIYGIAGLVVRHREGDVPAAGCT